MSSQKAPLSERAGPRLVIGLLIVLLGWTVATVFRLESLGQMNWYLIAVTILLAIGLYGSASGIPREALSDLPTVLAAITVGVALKIALIAGALLLVPLFSRPEAILFALAVAQIDPVSVAALRNDPRMSRRAKNVLLSWASFDDPITALLTVYLAAWLFPLQAAQSMDAYVENMGLNLALVAGALLLWWLGGLARRRLRTSDRSATIAQAGLLLAVVATAVVKFLMLGVALVGLFLRPFASRALDRVLLGALVLATFATGMLLTSGTLFLHGLILGAAAFVAQIVVGLVITWRYAWMDRVHIAFGQQNGITALLLSLALLPYLDSAVAVIVPAVVVVNTLHLVTNAAVDRGWLPTRRRRTHDDTTQPDAGAGTSAGTGTSVTAETSVTAAEEGTERPRPVRRSRQADFTTDGT
ncbi:hypothetical protein ACIBEJ_10040 [Nonomuraea sp. NPDC050790]|uniref:hypothetical protein n=1 Tax=Nonomuraea sp. NPDC050790 TaxID=3364371 RepID=UPI003787973B